MTHIERFIPRNQHGPHLRGKHDILSDDPLGNVYRTLVNELSSSPDTRIDARLDPDLIGPLLNTSSDQLL